MPLYSFKLPCKFYSTWVWSLFSTMYLSLSTSYHLSLEHSITAALTVHFISKQQHLCMCTPVWCHVDSLNIITSGFHFCGMFFQDCLSGIEMWSTSSCDTHTHTQSIGLKYAFYVSMKWPDDLFLNLLFDWINKS